ncbi:hypothetical protein MLD38_030340 [Melastoma candidum]|uniref:Uncharacterized protein n=1 Tax=Melastoma candidum TaxID=119954 RepID=A0ACB9MMK7_9MYRT|nr:hypothetical protein MLD38_030340 [Melastoma candidum]
MFVRKSRCRGGNLGRVKSLVGLSRKSERSLLPFFPFCFFPGIQTKALGDCGRNPYSCVDSEVSLKRSGEGNLR